MRKIPLSMIKPDMRLAKSIYHYNQLLLREGTAELNKYIPSLLNLGITSIYIEDKISEDIEIPDAISDVTRFKCKDALHTTFSHLKSQGSFDISSISDVIEELLEEILTRP